MIQLVVVAGVVAVGGAFLAVTARDGRLVAIGILVAMVAALLASSPSPTTPTVVFRLLGSVLAAYLLWAATSAPAARAGSVHSEGTGFGPLAEVAAAAAAFSAGLFMAPVKPLSGPVAAQAAGIAIVALALVPLTGRDVFRIGVAAVMMVIGGSLLLEAWVGPASALGQIVVTALLVGIVGATSVLISPIDSPAARPVATAPADTEAARSSEVTPAPGGQVQPARRGTGGATKTPKATPAKDEPAARPGLAPDAPRAGDPLPPVTGLDVELKPATGAPVRRRVPAGPMATRTPPKKLARRAAAEEIVRPAAATEPAAGRSHTSSVRTSPTRSLRGDQAGPRPPAHDAAPNETLSPSVQPQPGSIVSRVKRLRPREPR
jgi:hypothetical protein